MYIQNTVDMVIVARSDYAMVHFSLGIILAFAVALFVACMILATRKRDLETEVKELRKRLESYIIGNRK